VILIVTDALEKRFNLTILMTLRAASTLHCMGLERLVKLFLTRACHTLVANIVVAQFIASEELNMRLIDLCMANIAVQYTSIGCNRSAFHSAHFGLTKVSLLNCMAK
jgi:hypothetical protein